MKLGSGVFSQLVDNNDGLIALNKWFNSNKEIALKGNFHLQTVLLVYSEIYLKKPLLLY